MCTSYVLLMRHFVAFIPFYVRVLLGIDLTQVKTADGSHRLEIRGRLVWTWVTLRSSRLGWAKPIRKGRIMSKEQPNTPSRRSVLIAAAGVAPFLTLGVAKAGTLSQDSVNYQFSPNDGRHCSLCKYFQAPHSCQMVAGNIVPDGYCKLFQKKA